jgi:phosphate transport system substrate-binding protein
MKNTILIALAFLGLTTFANAQKIKGSDTVLPLTEKAAQAYMKKNSSKKIAVTGGGTGVGIEALIEGSTDIAQASRKIKFSEQQKIKAKGKAIKEITIGYDALAVVVNTGNKVTKLTREQLEGIFTGKIKNWKEVGGADLKIIPLSRETSSGTYEFFKEKVMSNKNYVSGIRSLPATGAIIQSVTQTKGAIAYVGFAYLNSSVKALSVSFNSGKSYTKPSVENAKNKTYPIVRPLYYYYLTSSESKVKDFVNYVLSTEGQKIVQTVGYIPAK